MARGFQTKAISGGLSVTRTPEFPGVDSFAGQICHTGQWPVAPMDFRGKRVAVLGTGSSAIQAIPEIAKEAADLSAFRRTPNFIFPSRNRPLDEAEHQAWIADRASLRAEPLGYEGFSVQSA